MSGAAKFAECVRAIFVVFARGCRVAVVMCFCLLLLREWVGQFFAACARRPVRTSQARSGTSASGAICLNRLDCGGDCLREVGICMRKHAVESGQRRCPRRSIFLQG